MTAVFTSWISPCCVLINNFKKKTFFLAASSLTSTISHLICLCLLNFALNTCKSFEISEAPAIYCFKDFTLIPNQSNFSHIIGYDKTLKLCYNGETCHKVIRLCSNGESPNDLFNQIIFPLAIVMMLISFASSICLQMMGNYFCLYKWSSYVFKTPIAHPSFLQDYLMNRKDVSLKIQDEMDEVFESIITNNPTIINQKDPLNGETCMHAAFYSSLYQHLDKMIQVGGNNLNGIPSKTSKDEMS